MTDPITRLNAALEGRYRIEREIGEGGMATVYLAHDERHNRNVALKVLKPELAAVVGAERFLAEIETTAQLTHPHILPLHDSGEADGFLFFVTPYIEGDTLRDKIDREKQLSVEEALEITKRVASALDYAHEHGVVHRDIKPGNILLSEKGEPTVADFGIALAVAQAGGGRVTETGLSVGTPHYMSPEQATGDRDVDPRTDVYALGSILYEMLTGDPPYQGSTAQAVLGQIITGKPVSAVEKRASVPPNVDAAIRKALEKLPADRFGSAQDFAGALGDPGFRHGELVAAEGTAGASPWNRLATVGWSVAAVAVLALGWSLLRPEPVQLVSRQVLSTRGWAGVSGPTGRYSALAPDGSSMILPDTTGPTGVRLALKLRGSTEITPIPGTEQGRDVVYSPDGQWIAYGVGTELFKRPLVGGAPVRLAEDAAGGTLGLAWLPGGEGGVLGVEVAQLVAPPGVPPPIERSEPATLVVNLETNEQTMRLADGVEYTYWTFGGSVPGPLLRVRVGDFVEFQLSNHPSSENPHNIDLHAVNGPGGGAVSSLVAPGRSATFAFQALNPGLYVYHCATAPVGMHVANGMYGLILVEPEEGLPAVDHEYYVMQGEVYTAGEYGSPGLQPFDMEKAMAEDPPYVVFNGSVSALTGANALSAETGETVRIFAGNGGPSLTSSFHVIGEIFERVQVEAGSMMNENVQTTSIPPGGAAIVEFNTDVPGDFLIVDHALFRAFNKGALGILTVTGEEDAAVYAGLITEGVYEPEGGAIQSLAAPAPPPAVASSVGERIVFGSEVYARSCVACHQAEGAGVGDAFPPLASSDFLNADRDRAIRSVVAGLSGPITVNGVEYRGQMPPLGLSDEEVANVLTYVYSQWNNSGDIVTPEDVRAVRLQPVSN